MDNSTVFAHYYNLTLRYLSYRPRSEKEVLDYLKEKSSAAKAPEGQAKMIQDIIIKLKEYKFIDDEKFAKFWFEQRSKFKRKPIRVVEYELNQKGINKQIIEEVLSGFDSKDLDLENAKKLAAKKLDFYRNLDPKKRQEKVMNFLLRRGFNYDIVKKVFD